MDSLEQKFADIQQELARFSIGSGLPNCPTFDGSTDFTKFLRDFNKYSTANSWSPTRACQVLPVFLNGPASAVYDSLDSTTKSTWKSLVDALSTKFAKSFDKESARRQLFARRQQKGESLHAFAFDIKDLAQKAFPKSTFPEATKDEDYAKFIDDMAKDHFRNNLLHEIREKILFQPVPATFVDAINDAKRVEEILQVLHEQEAKHELQKLREEICNVRNELEQRQEIEAENEENDEQNEWDEDCENEEFEDEHENEEFDEEQEEDFDEEKEEWHDEEMQEHPENLHQQNSVQHQKIGAIRFTPRSRSSSPALFPLFTILAIFCITVNAEHNKAAGHYFIESVKVHHQWMKSSFSYNESVIFHHHWKNTHPILMVDESAVKYGGAPSFRIFVTVLVSPSSKAFISVAHSGIQPFIDRTSTAHISQARHTFPEHGTHGRTLNNVLRLHIGYS